jgi:sugar lactone lactonase YvrE
VFPPRLVPAPPGIPGLPPELPMQAVPTSVAVGPDGAYYVGQLTGFPFPVGGARVFRVVPGHRPQVFARGFTNIIDIAFDRRGRLHVLEIATNGILSGDFTGRLVRVNRNGSRTVLASEGLFAPGGFAIAHDGSIYVTNNGILAGAGQVLRIPPR